MKAEAHNIINIRLEEMTIRYSQDADDCTDDDFQSVEIKTQDGGGGKFLIIKTERWAIESVKEMKTLIEDFEKRLNMKSKSIHVHDEE